MIPKTIHYCWFGRGEMPQLAKECIASWHTFMPEWKYKLWSEDIFDVKATPYTKEAYEAGKYAFVSDYVRLWALEQEGGLYLDVDFEVYKAFDDLMSLPAFAGIEGSKHQPLMMGVCASEPHGDWVNEMREAYLNRHFITDDGTQDLTTNVQFITGIMSRHGFRQDGTEQDYKDLHIFPVDYFCPRLTTGEYVRTGNTYCEHKGLSSWCEGKGGWKKHLLNLIGPNITPRLIKLKRKLFG